MSFYLKPNSCLSFAIISERYILKSISRNNNPVICSFSSIERTLSPKEKSKVLSVSPFFYLFNKYYILNKHAFNNTFHSTFHPVFETSSDFTFRSDYKQIISDNKKKAECVIKQEFLDIPLISETQPLLFTVTKWKSKDTQGLWLIFRSSESVFDTSDLRNYHVYSRGLGSPPIAYFNSGHWLL